MIYNKYPVFKRGSILKRDDLKLLRDNPLDILEILYKNKKDGIIEGLEIEIDEENRQIIINSGILKVNKIVCWLRKKYRVNMPIIEENYILKVKVNKTINKDYIEIKGDIILEVGENIGKNELELTRFITREGAELRNDYRNFYDLRRDFNLLDIINVKYSSNNKKGTLHPKILELYRKDLEKKGNIDALDINLYMNSILDKIIEREGLIFYINHKLNLKQKDYTNEEIYEKMVEILNNFENKTEKIEKKKMIPKKITVD